MLNAFQTISNPGIFLNWQNSKRRENENKVNWKRESCMRGKRASENI